MNLETLFLKRSGSSNQEVAAARTMHRRKFIAGAAKLGAAALRGQALLPLLRSQSSGDPVLDAHEKSMADFYRLQAGYASGAFSSAGSSDVELLLNAQRDMWNFVYYRMVETGRANEVDTWLGLSSDDDPLNLANTSIYDCDPQIVLDEYNQYNKLVGPISYENFLDKVCGGRSNRPEAYAAARAACREEGGVWPLAQWYIWEFLPEMWRSRLPASRPLLAPQSNRLRPLREPCSGCCGANKAVSFLTLHVIGLNVAAVFGCAFCPMLSVAYALPLGVVHIYKFLNCP